MLNTLQIAVRLLLFSPRRAVSRSPDAIELRFAQRGSLVSTLHPIAEAPAAATIQAHARARSNGLGPLGAPQTSLPTLRAPHRAHLPVAAVQPPVAPVPLSIPSVAVLVLRIPFRQSLAVLQSAESVFADIPASLAPARLRAADCSCLRASVSSFSTAFRIPESACSFLFF